MSTSSEIYLGILTICSVCLALTIILELFFAIIFRVRKKNLLVVILAQIVTNPIVVLASNYIGYTMYGTRSGFSDGFALGLVILEPIAVFAEGMLYKYFFKDYSFMNPYVLSLLLNLLSFLIGIGAAFIYGLASYSR